MVRMIALHNIFIHCLKMSLKLLFLISAFHFVSPSILTVDVGEDINPENWSFPPNLANEPFFFQYHYNLDPPSFSRNISEYLRELGIYEDIIRQTDSFGVWATYGGYHSSDDSDDGCTKGTEATTVVFAEDETVLFTEDEMESTLPPEESEETTMEEETSTSAVPCTKIHPAISFRSSQQIIGFELIFFSFINESFTSQITLTTFDFSEEEIETLILPEDCDQLQGEFWSWCKIDLKGKDGINETARGHITLELVSYPGDAILIDKIILHLEQINPTTISTTSTSTQRPTPNSAAPTTKKTSAPTPAPSSTIRTTDEIQPSSTQQSNASLKTAISFLTMFIWIVQKFL